MEWFLLLASCSVEVNPGRCLIRVLPLLSNVSENARTVCDEIKRLEMGPVGPKAARIRPHAGL